MLQDCPETIMRASQRARFSQALPILGGVFALIVYLGIAWTLLPPQAVWSPDEGAKLLQLQSLRWDNDHLLQDIAYVGRGLDPKLQFVRPDLSRGLISIKGKVLFFQRLPLFTLMTEPLFRWLGFPGLYLLPAIAGALCSVFALQLLKPEHRRLQMWLLTAFASPIFIYSTIFWEHTLATSLGLLATWLALRTGLSSLVVSSRKRLAWIVVGVVLGASAYIRLEMLVFAWAMLIACWYIFRANRRGPVWAIMSLGLVLVPYVPLHQAMFGQAGPENARYLFYPFRYLRMAGLQAVPDLIIGPFRDEAVDPGWLGGVWSTAAVVTVVSSKVSRTWTRHLQMIGLGITAIAGTVFLFSHAEYRSGHGLLFTTPWALLGLSRAREVWQHQDVRARVILLTTLLGLAGYGIGMIGLRAGSPQGGLEWGARLAMTFYPLLALIAAWDWGTRPNDPVRLAVIGTLIFLGLGFQVRGVWTLGHDKRINGELNRTLVKLPEFYVVSDLWWMLFNAAPIHEQKAIFVAPTPSDLRDWIELAADQHVRQFCFVSLDRFALENVRPLVKQRQLVTLAVIQVEHLFIYRIAIEPDS